MPASFPDRIRAVAFDLDGLMINSEHVFAIAAEKMLAKRGIALYLPNLAAPCKLQYAASTSTLNPRAERLGSLLLRPI